MPKDIQPSKNNIPEKIAEILCTILLQSNIYKLKSYTHSWQTPHRSLPIARGLKLFFNYLLIC